VRLLVQWVFVDGSRDCALKAERVRGALLLHSTILTSLCQVLAEHAMALRLHECTPQMLSCTVELRGWTSKAHLGRTNNPSRLQGMGNMDLKAANSVLVWDPLQCHQVATAINFGDVSCGHGHPRGPGRAPEMDLPEVIMQAKAFLRRGIKAFKALMKERNIAFDSAECEATYNRHFDPARVAWALPENKVRCSLLCPAPTALQGSPCNCAALPPVSTHHAGLSTQSTAWTYNAPEKRAPAKRQSRVQHSACHRIEAKHDIRQCTAAHGPNSSALHRTAPYRAATDTSARSSPAHRTKLRRTILTAAWCGFTGGLASLWNDVPAVLQPGGHVGERPL
jgi:hypothetical protein